MQETDGRGAACYMFREVLSFFFSVVPRLSVGLFAVQDDQVTVEKRTETATSGASRPLHLPLPNCIERARKKLQ